MKKTRKYTGALSAAQAAGISTDGDQEALYQRLAQAGYFWESTRGQWTYTAPEAADPPTPLILVRIWAATDRVAAEAQREIDGRLAVGYQLIERSDPYVCRPPKQAESRVYLKFLPPPATP